MTGTTINSKSAGNMTFEWRLFEDLFAKGLYELLQFRQSIFVVEQGSPYPDLDGHDQRAWHLVGRVEAQLTGYLRLMPVVGPPPLVRIGRVAVASHLRARGLGRMLMHESLRFHARNYGGQRIMLGAQAHLAAYYAKFGFETVGEPYDDFGVPHIEMRLLPKA